MKNLVCLIFSLFLCFIVFFPTTKTVYAYDNGEYLRVIDESTPFYQTQSDSEPLFFLPYTYYVKVLDQNKNFYHVEVYGEFSQPAIDGYVPIGLLFDDGLEVQNPYLSINVYTVNTTVLYADASLTHSLQYVFSDRQLTYYGKITLESGNVFFVGYNNRLGYVKEENVLPFSIPNHPNPLTFLPDEKPDDNALNNQPADFLSIRITIIACLIFAGIIGLFVALGKKKETAFNTNEYYDENDYG